MSQLGDERWIEGSCDTHAPPTLEDMRERGLQLLEAHLRSFDPGEATARERLEEELGEPLARRLVFALALLPTPLPPRRHFLAA